MNNILDQIARANADLQNTDQYVALQIAKRFQDAQTRSYTGIATRFGALALASAYHRTRPGSGPAWDRFKEALPRSTTAPGFRSPLVVFRISRRAIAAAVFVGLSLEYTQVRELTSNKEEAEKSCIGFAAWILDQFRDATVALEQVAPGDETQQQMLHAAVVSRVREAAVPLWEIGTDVVVQSFGSSCKTRGQFRKRVTAIWPALQARFTNAAVFDAVGLGLFAQSMRLLDSGEELAVPA